MICFHMYRISLEYLSERNNKWALQTYFPSKLWTEQCTACSIQQYTAHPVALQCVQSNSSLHILSLYGVFTSAVHLTSCHSTVCSLQQCTAHPVTTLCSLQPCTWHPVTVQLTPAVHLTSCHSTVSSLQQYTSHLVTLHYVRSSSALDTVSLWDENRKDKWYLNAKPSPDFYSHICTNIYD